MFMLVLGEVRNFGRREFIIYHMVGVQVDDRDVEIYNLRRTSRNLCKVFHAKHSA